MIDRTIGNVSTVEERSVATAGADPAVVGGRIVWILDGYTTSDGYPYSERRVLGDVTADALTRTSSSVAAQGQREVNYIRNSVKAVVDAYDGSVSLYEWQPK